MTGTCWGHNRLWALLDPSIAYHSLSHYYSFHILPFLFSEYIFHDSLPLVQMRQWVTWYLVFMYSTVPAWSEELSTSQPNQACVQRGIDGLERWRHISLSRISYLSCNTISEMVMERGVFHCYIIVTKCWNYFLVSHMLDLDGRGWIPTSGPDCKLYRTPTKKTERGTVTSLVSQVFSKQVLTWTS